MPQISDRQSIRQILEKDPLWAAYALADLEPAYFVFTSWFGAADGSAITLVYRAFLRPVLICVGAADVLDSLLTEVNGALPDSEELYVVVKPDVLPLIRKRYAVKEERRMLRMALDARHHQPVSPEGVARLNSKDLDAVKMLYSGEPPEFFLENMLVEGVYYGLYEGSSLAAIAGTHVIAPKVGVAGLGNIYTRRDRRQQGYSTRVTGALTDHLLESGFRTIILNVREDNEVAIRLYERLGYYQYCRYYEVIAVRRSEMPSL